MNNMPVFDAEVVDKSMIVIGSFAADALDDAKKNRAGHANWCGQFPRSGHRTCRL